MSKAIEDVISTKVAKALLKDVNVDSIIAKKLPTMEKVVGDMVDEIFKGLKRDYIEVLRDNYYETSEGQLTDLLDKVVYGAVAKALGVKTKKTKNRK